MGTHWHSLYHRDPRGSSLIEALTGPKIRRLYLFQALHSSFRGFFAAAPGRPSAQGGFTLIATLVALAILGALGPALLASSSTHSKATGIVDERVNAANVASSYLEAIKACSYADTYPNASCPLDDITHPLQLSVAIDTDCSTDGTTWLSSCSGENLQMVTAFISREGQRVLSLAAFRTKR